jgi:hypothetical protein
MFPPCNDYRGPAMSAGDFATNELLSGKTPKQREFLLALLGDLGMDGSIYSDS